MRFEKSVLVDLKTTDEALVNIKYKVRIRVETHLRNVNIEGV